MNRYNIGLQLTLRLSVSIKIVFRSNRKLGSFCNRKNAVNHHVLTIFQMVNLLF